MLLLWAVDTGVVGKLDLAAPKGAVGMAAAHMVVNLARSVTVAPRYKGVEHKAPALYTLKKRNAVDAPQPAATAIINDNSP